MENGRRASEKERGEMKGGVRNMKLAGRGQAFLASKTEGTELF